MRKGAWRGGRVGAGRGEGFCWVLAGFGVVGIKGGGYGGWERGLWGVDGKQRKILEGGGAELEVVLRCGGGERGGKGSGVMGG